MFSQPSRSQTSTKFRPSIKKWQDDKGIWHYGDTRPISPDAVTNSAADAYRRGDFAMAFEEYMTWAKQGDPRAQTMVGLMYLRGEGVAPRSQ